MKEYILDTHAFVWWATRPGRLGRAAAHALSQVDRGRALAWVPSIVGVELALLCELGWLLRIGVVEFEAAMQRNSAVRILPRDLAQAKEFSLLLSLDDPFDRMIVAAARARNRPLITADHAVTASGLVDVIWN